MRIYEIYDVMYASGESLGDVVAMSEKIAEITETSVPYVIKVASSLLSDGEMAKEAATTTGDIGKYWGEVFSGERSLSKDLPVAFDEAKRLATGRQIEDTMYGDNFARNRPVITKSRMKSEPWDHLRSRAPKSRSETPFTSKEQRNLAELNKNTREMERINREAGKTVKKMDETFGRNIGSEDIHDPNFRQMTLEEAEKRFRDRGQFGKATEPIWVTPPAEAPSRPKAYERAYDMSVPKESLSPLERTMRTMREGEPTLDKLKGLNEKAKGMIR
jgi:hypothetical protein